MLRNYLKVAWRALRKHPVYAFVNVLGLGAAIATCLLIGFYIQDELRYDTFHPDAHRTLALVIDGDVLDGLQRTTPPGFASLLRAEIPGVEHVTRTDPVGSVRFAPQGSERGGRARDLQVMEADSSFFDVLTGFPVRGGRRADALDVPGEAVLTASAAQSLFGDRNPIGQVVRTDEEPVRRYTVVGITQVPEHSTVQFDVVVRPPSPSTPASPWTDFTSRIYARVDESVRPDTLSATLQEAMPSDPLEPFVDEVDMIPLPDLYLSDAYSADGFKGQPRYLYLFGSVGLLILLIAGVNYVNLAVSQVDRRTGEVGLRRTMGARRRQVVGQFLVETMLLTLAAFGLGVALVAVVLPAVNALLGKSLSFGTARHIWVLAGGLGGVLAFTLVAGAYPAFLLSGLRPVQTLRGGSQTLVDGGGWLQKGLVVAQFAVSAGLIFGTVVIYQQLDYLQTKDLGFNEEQVVTVPLGDLSPEREKALRRAARNHSAVQQATIGGTMPGRRVGLRFPGLNLKAVSDSARGPDREFELYPVKVDTNYVEALGLDVIAGRRFGEVTPDQRRNGYILNEETVRVFGWTPETAVGMPFGLFGSQGEVIGVVENFHVEALRQPIAPVALTLSADFEDENSSVLAARLAPGAVEAGLDHLRRVTQGVAPESAFEYAFLDDRFDQMYRSEQRLGRIFVGFALIAVVLAAMGLFGLASYAVQRRTQELGIRKALGATGTSILGLLSREYGLLMGGALLVGLPLAYLGVEQWLRAFAYRVGVSVGAFALTVGLVILIATASIGYHGLRAVRIDPARTLRQE